MHHRIAEAVEQNSGAVAEGLEGACVARARQMPDGLGIGGTVVAKVQRATVGPPMPREDFLLEKGHMRLERGARRGKEVVEDVAHGQNGRAGVDAVHLTHLAADMPVPFQHRDVIAGMGQRKRSAQTSDARADHYDRPGGTVSVGCRRRCHVWIVDSRRQPVQYDLHLSV